MSSLFRVVVFIFFVIFESKCSNDLDDTCVIHYLKEKSLINPKIIPDQELPKFIVQKCDRIVPKIAENLFKEKMEELVRNDTESRDNVEFKECVKKLYEKFSMRDKFLKVKTYQDFPQIERVDEVMEVFNTQVVNQCTKIIEVQASQRFQLLVSNQSNPLMPPLHPAKQEIINNLDCMIAYAIENELFLFDTLPEAILNQTQLSMSNNETLENCESDLLHVKDLIMDEWYILKKFEDDQIQRCFIQILEDSQEIDMFIKSTVFGQLKTDQDDEMEKNLNDEFIEHQKTLHKDSYKCILEDFHTI